MKEKLDAILKNQEEILNILKGTMVQPIPNISDAEICLVTILNTFAAVDGVNETINYWIEKYIKIDDIQRGFSHIPAQLRRNYGIILNDDSIDLACNHDYIKTVLRRSGRGCQYSKLLKTHPKYIADAPKTARFNGIGKSIVRIKL